MSHCNLALENLLVDAGIMPVVTITDIEHAVPLANALLEGGLTVIEITMRTAIALTAVVQIRKKVPKMIVGVGTVNNAERFNAAYAAGASFAVSPGVTDALIDVAGKISMPYLPGVATPSEAMQLYDLGYQYLKLFPAEAVGGCELLKAIAAPLPEIKFCPTGGINFKKAPDYLSLANVICVGGSWLTPKELILQKNWQGITALAQQSALLK